MESSPGEGGGKMKTYHVKMVIAGLGWARMLRQYEFMHFPWVGTGFGQSWLRVVENGNMLTQGLRQNLLGVVENGSMLC